MTTDTTTISAVDNPALVNQLTEKALKSVPQEAVREESPIKPPSDPQVTLLAGLQVPFGEFISTAEVRELTGADEEAIARISDISKGLMTILERAVVKLNDSPVDRDLLDTMLAGDRELLLLEIRKLTFGSEVAIEGQICSKCEDTKSITIDLDKDVPMKKLENDPVFTVKCKIGDVKVKLPNGVVQKQLVTATNKTAPELDSIVLKSCVLEINGNPILDSNTVLKMSVSDRRAILNAISERNPGPQLQQIKKECPTCGQEVSLPLTLADLFQ
jgi:hypothetical protein